MPNAQYNVAAPNSLSQRLAGYQRRRMYARFLAECRPEPGDTLVDVGATSDRSYEHSNYLEAWYPHKNKITAVLFTQYAPFGKVPLHKAFRDAVYSGIPDALAH